MGGGRSAATASAPDPEPRRRTQRERRAETERRVLDATAAIVSRGGASAVTLAEVGRLAGYSRGIVTHHFGSRQALIEAVASAAQERLAPPAEQPPGLERLVDFVEAYLDRIRGGDVYARGFLLLWAESVGASVELRKMFVDRDQVIAAEILGNLEAARLDGSARPDLDLAANATALIAQLRGTGLQLIIAGEDLDFERLREAILDGLRRTLRTDGAASATRAASR